MNTMATVLGFMSGFALMGYHQGPLDLIATSLAIDATLAPLTAIIASRHGRSTALWAILGFALGMWALAVILIATRRSEPPYPPPSPHRSSPPSDAA